MTQTATRTMCPICRRRESVTQDGRCSRCYAVANNATKRLVDLDGWNAVDAAAMVVKLLKAEPDLKPDQIVEACRTERIKNAKPGDVPPAKSGTTKPAPAKNAPATMPDAEPEPSETARALQLLHAALGLEILQMPYAGGVLFVNMAASDKAALLRKDGAIVPAKLIVELAKS